MKIVFLKLKTALILSLLVGTVFLFPSNVKAAELPGYQFFPISNQLGQVEIPNNCTRMAYTESAMGFTTRHEIAITRNEVGRITKLESTKYQINREGFVTATTGTLVFDIQYDASKLLPIGGTAVETTINSQKQTWDVTYTSNALGQIISYSEVATYQGGNVVERPPFTYTYDAYGHVDLSGSAAFGFYTYDEVGNIIGTMQDAYFGYCPYVYDEQMRLTQKIITNDEMMKQYAEFYYD